MESRGRGIRSRKSRGGDDEEEAKAPPTPISNAWADFMTEQGMGPAAASSSSTTQEETTTATSSNDKKAAASTASDQPREYILPLTKEWTTDKPRSKKKAKTTTSTGGAALLVQTGTLDSSMIGRTKRTLNQPYDLQVPTSIMPSLKVSKVIASCNGAHAVCIDEFGKAYGWGRNEADQLSQSLPQVVPLATLLDFDHGTVVDGAVGKSHTMLLTKDSTLYSVGSNKSGQCGVRNFADVPNFRKCVAMEGINIVQVGFIELHWRASLRP